MRLFDVLFAKSISGGGAQTVSDLEVSFPDFLEGRTVASANNASAIKVNEGVTRIAPDSFKTCPYLQSLILPRSLKSIGMNAFKDCTALSSLILPEGLEEIKQSAFANCIALVDLHIPSSVKTIFGNAFYQCNSLKSLVITEGVERIAQNAFWMCTSLERLVLPRSLNSLESSAFNGCDSLRVIDMTAFDETKIPALVETYGNVFQCANPIYTFVFSNQVTLDAFSAASGWSNYASYFEVAT